MRSILLIIIVFVVGMTLASRTQLWHDAGVLTECGLGPHVFVGERMQRGGGEIGLYRADTIGRDLLTGEYVLRQGSVEMRFPQDQSLAVVRPAGASGFTAVTWTVLAATMLLLPLIALWGLLAPLQNLRRPA